MVGRGSTRGAATGSPTTTGSASTQVSRFTAVGKGRVAFELSYAKPSGGKPKRVALIQLQVL